MNYTVNGALVYWVIANGVCVCVCKMKEKNNSEPRRVIRSTFCHNCHLLQRHRNIFDSFYAIELLCSVYAEESCEVYLKK